MSTASPRSLMVVPRHRKSENNQVGSYQQTRRTIRVSILGKARARDCSRFSCTQMGQGQTTSTTSHLVPVNGSGLLQPICGLECRR